MKATLPSLPVLTLPPEAQMAAMLPLDGAALCKAICRPLEGAALRDRLCRPLDTAAAALSAWLHSPSFGNAPASQH